MTEAFFQQHRSLSQLLASHTDSNISSLERTRREVRKATLVANSCEHEGVPIVQGRVVSLGPVDGQEEHEKELDHPANKKSKKEKPAEVVVAPLLSSLTVRRLLEIWNNQWTHNSTVHRPLGCIYERARRGYKRWGGKSVEEWAKKVRRVIRLTQLMDLHHIPDPASKLQDMMNKLGVSLDKLSKLYADTIKSQGLSSDGRETVPEQIIKHPKYKPEETFWGPLVAAHV